ncbi:CD1845 family protein [Intestinimonas timonensis]|uniref:CD1845 family protein n=1 Tax=Intestinimonas timonensis TaxID=1689270 RepID=UPI0030FEB1E5
MAYFSKADTVIQNPFVAVKDISTFCALWGVFQLIVGPRHNGVIVLILAFLISPYGLPMAAIWLLGKVQDLKFAIQDKIYG